MLIILVIPAALGSAPTARAGDLKLPLQEGLYLPAGVKSPAAGETAVSTASLSYHGEGLSLHRYRGKFKEVRHEGNIYFLTQRCVCKGEDVLTINLTILIKSRTSFSLLKDAEE